MAKAEPDIVEVNRLIKGEPGPGTVKTIDVENALAVLRAKNARLKEQTAVNAKTHAANIERHQKDYEGWRSANLKLQIELLASQERVFELQDKLLALRALVNSSLTKESTE